MQASELTVSPVYGAGAGLIGAADSSRGLSLRFPRFIR